MNHAKLLEHRLHKDSLSRSRLTYLDDSEEWITLAGDLDLDGASVVRFLSESTHEVVKC